METVTSRNGTTIALDRSGEGPAVILVGGAFQHRAFDPGVRSWPRSWPSTSPFSTTTAGGGATPGIPRPTRSSASSRIWRP
jgi:hypothetical protein